MRILLIAASLVFVGYAAGYQSRKPCIDPNRVVDPSGRTSITIYLPDGDWCELRGPGRFRALDYFGKPTACTYYDGPIEDASRADYFDVKFKAGITPPSL